MEEKIKTIMKILVIVIMFSMVSFFMQRNVEHIQGYLITGFLGIIIYILIEISSIVIAPVTTIFLLPIASNLWGWYYAALISIFAWTVGAWIAFLLARKYGVPLVKHFVPIEELHKIENKVPRKHLFFTIIFLRVLIPMDILSYILGLFSKVKTRTYVFATMIGVTPYAILISYMGVLPFIYQIIGWIILGIIILIGIITIRNIKGTNKRKK